MGDGEHPVAVQLPLLKGYLVYVGGACLVLDEIGTGERRGQLQIGRQADRRIPAMRYETDTLLLGHPPYPPLLANAPNLGHVGLHHVEGTGLQEGRIGLAPRQDLPTGDRDGCHLPEGNVVLQGVRFERLLEPCHVVGGEYVGRAQGPLVVPPPEGVAPTGVDHERRFLTDGLPRGSHDRFVGCSVLTSEGTPPDLERLEALLLET